MRTKYTLKFYVNKYTEKNGKCTIYGRIRFRQKKNEFATHLTIKPSEWNEEFMQPVNNPFMKRELSKIENDIQNTVNRLEYEQIHIDSKSIKDYYTGKDKIDMGILEYFDRVIKQKSKISSTTHNKYSVLRDDVGKFIKTEYKTKDLDMNRLDYKFLVSFDYYLKSINSKQFNRPLQPATINKKHEYFRTVLRQAYNEDLIRKTPYNFFKIRKPYCPPKSLTMSELNKIINLDLSENEILDRIRDVFLFTVFAGFRYGDAQRLTMDNIIVTDGKYETIYLNSQQKNSIPVSIPVLPKVDEIIRKYEYSSERLILNRILPKFTNAYFNRRIKEIAKLCKIEMNLHHHVGRHTFASTILTENGVSIYEVQKWMGHSSINSTKVYSHVTPSRMKKTAEMLAKAL